MHDTMVSAEQRRYVNEWIAKNAEHVLRISQNDDYRSIANYNMALYYLESTNMVDPSPEEIMKAQKAREYAGRAAKLF